MREFDQGTRGVWEFARIREFRFGELCEIGECARLIRQVGFFENAFIGRVREFDRGTRGVWEFACIGNSTFGELCVMGEGARHFENMDKSLMTLSKFKHGEFPFAGLHCQN